MGLVVVAGVVVIRVATELIGAIPFGVDMDIPLRAADRWLHGGQPYLPSSFDVLPGADGRDLPFLYPPFILPLLAPFLSIPHEITLAVWSVACLTAAILAIRRLGIPVVWWPIVLCWPPLSSGIISTNVQLPLFAAFVYVFWRRPQVPLRPCPKTAPTELGRTEGILAVVVAAIKVSQVHVWLYLVRQRNAWAIVAGGVLAILILLSMGLIGPAIWSDWLAQSVRASDPSWPVIGGPLSVYIGAPLARVAAIISIVAALALRSSRPGTWLGVLMIVASPTIQPFGWLFLMPGMLEVRRELGLLAAILIAVHSSATAWVAVGLVSAALLAADRWPGLLEPIPQDSSADSAPLREPA